MNRDHEVSARYYGIGGWLLLFIIILAVLGPANTISNIILGIERIQSSHRMLPTYRLLLEADLVTGAILILASLGCGVLLLRKSRNAVEITKYVLVAYLFYGLAFAIAYGMLGLKRWWVPDRFTSSLIWFMIRNIVSFAIWFSYLCKSKRVAATYGPLGVPPLKIFSAESTASQTPA